MLSPTDTALTGARKPRLPAMPGSGIQQFDGPMLNADAPAGAPPPPRPMGLPPGLNPGAVTNPVPTATQSMPQVNPATAGPASAQKFDGPMLNAQAGAPMPETAPPAPTLKGVSVAGINPSSDLRNTTIAPTDAVDRFGLVNDRLKNYDATALPQFQANIRGLVGKNAALGRTGSGMLNTDLGNETLAAENARNSYFGNLLTDATQGTIADAANNRAELRGERGYQTGQEQSAFDRARQGVFDTETLKNGQFGRDFATTQLGYENNPASLLAQLSSIISGQGGQTAAGAGSNAAGGSTMQILQQILDEAMHGQQTPTVPVGNIPATPGVRG
jgi:hypothetical protein